MKKNMLLVATVMFLLGTGCQAQTREKERSRPAAMAKWRVIENKDPMTDKISKMAVVMVPWSQSLTSDKMGSLVVYDTGRIVLFLQQWLLSSEESPRIRWRIDDRQFVDGYAKPDMRSKTLEVAATVKMIQAMIGGSRLRLMTVENANVYEFDITGFQDVVKQLGLKP